MHPRLYRIKERLRTSTTLAFVYVWRGRAVNRTGWGGWVIRSLWWESCKLIHTHAKMVRIGLSLCLSFVCLFTCPPVSVFVHQLIFFADFNFVLFFQLLFVCPVFPSLSASLAHCLSRSLSHIHTHTHTHSHRNSHYLISRGSSHLAL